MRRPIPPVPIAHIPNFNPELLCHLPSRLIAVAPVVYHRSPELFGVNLVRFAPARAVFLVHTLVLSDRGNCVHPFGGRAQSRSSACYTVHIRSGEETRGHKQPASPNEPFVVALV